MKTVFDPAHRKELIDRVNNLNTNSNRHWGKMRPDQSLHHINTALSAHVGDLKPSGGSASNAKAAFLKLFTFSPIPIPKGKAETIPEFRADGTYDLNAEKVRFKSLVERIAAKANEKEWPVSPIFGKLSGEQYGMLGYKHTDHHLKQFGV